MQLIKISGACHQLAEIQYALSKKSKDYTQQTLLQSSIRLTQLLILIAVSHYSTA